MLSMTMRPAPEHEMFGEDVSARTPASHVDATGVVSVAIVQKTDAIVVELTVTEWLRMQNEGLLVAVFDERESWVAEEPNTGMPRRNRRVCC